MCDLVALAFFLQCLHLWDLDPRGFHNGLWRFWLKHNHILVMGSPYSSYTK